MGLLIECPQCKERSSYSYQREIEEEGRTRVVQAARETCPHCQSKLTKKVYWIELYTKDGRRRRERCGTDKRQAESILNKRLTERREDRLFVKRKDDKVRFDKLSEWFLALPETKQKKSYDRDVRSVDKLKAFFKTRPISEIKPSRITEYQAHRLSENSYRGGGTKPATVNREIACLKTMFNRAIRDGKIETSPMRGIKMLKENNERERVLAPEEWEKYKSHCPAWYLPIAITAYRTAMRKREILNLTLSRVDLKEGFIRLRPEDTKNGYGRSIPLHSELIEVLKDAMKVRLLNCDLVFHRDGKAITPHDVRKAHERICETTGIEGFVFHDYRHTCINDWRKQGHDYYRIMKASGHKTMSVFFRYNMVDEEELRSLVNPVDTPVDTRQDSEKEKEVNANG